MAQHDYVIANQGFPAFRSDLNNALAAIVSNNSGATEPTTMFAHQMWVDTAANPSILKIRNADNDAWITIGTINQTGDTFTLTSAVSATTLNTSGAVVFNDAGADVDFRVEGDTDANLVFVDASTDRMGVGTSSPANKLQVAGNIGIGNGNFLGWGSLDTLIYGDSSSNFMYFRTNTAERVRIDSNGNLLVGTTSGSQHNIHKTASGGLCCNIQNNATTGGFVLQLASATAASSTFDFITAYSSIAGTPATQFRVRGDGVIYAQNTTVQSVSDVRVKENIYDSTDGLDVILKLRPVRFDFKDGFNNNRKNQLGFIAQEVEPVFSDAVDVTSEADEAGDPYKSVGPSAFIPVLVKAIQELKAELDTVKAELATLKG